MKKVLIIEDDEKWKKYIADYLKAYEYDVTALEDFDNRMEEIFNAMKEDDILIITADHGCDPTTSGTDHSREYIPILVYGENIKENIDIGVQSSFSNIGKSILDYLSIKNTLPGESFLKEVLKEE